MPWKNRQGSTTQLAIHPPDAGLDDFTWRVSIADVAASGPFSSFAGCERILAQLDGPPATLAIDGRALRLVRLEPYRFAGESATHATLEGPARIFNVIARRERVRADLSTRSFAPGEVFAAPGGGGVRLVFLVAGAASVDAGDRTVTLRAEDAVLADPGSDLAFVVGPEGATALLLSLEEGASFAPGEAGRPRRAPGSSPH